MTSIWLSGLRRIRAGEPLPTLAPADMILATSSGEVEILSASAPRSWLAALARSSPRAAVRFVSIGCSGLAACVLEFMQSDCQSAHVLVTEAPVDWVQSTLDAAGLGAGGDGFQAQEVTFVLTLSRGKSASAPSSVRLLHGDLLSRDTGLDGTARLAARFAGLVRELHEEYPRLRMVRFDNGSRWSHHLASLVDAFLHRHGLPATRDWLPSVECDLRHYMCARPLLDWQVHAATLETSPLLLACLGAGGRLGLLVIGPHDLHKSRLAGPVPQPLDLEAPDWSRRLRAHSERPRHVFYTRREYFGRQHFYFRWKLTHEHFSNP